MAEYKMVWPVLIAFAISVILGPFVIPYLRKLKMGQTERVDGVQSHLKKAGTPTMGGVIFLLSTVITSLFYIKDYPKIIPVLFLTLGFGIIGFLDDYLKVVFASFRRSDARSENGMPDCCNCNFRILYYEIYRCSDDFKNSVCIRL